MTAVYPNLAGEIAKRGIKKCVLAKEAGITAWTRWRTEKVENA